MSKYSRKVELREADKRRAANEADREQTRQAAARREAARQQRPSRLRAGAEAMPWHGREWGALPARSPSSRSSESATAGQAARAWQSYRRTPRQLKCCVSRSRRTASIQSAESGWLKLQATRIKAVIWS